jgi:hypothetical protein
VHVSNLRQLAVGAAKAMLPSDCNSRLLSRR